MTSEQRLERLRDVLTGKRRSPLAPYGVQGQEQGPTRSNLLTAVALHAAGRFWKGEPATDLEGRLLALMRTELSDDDIKAIGALYRFAVTYPTDPLLLPESVTSRPVTSGYDWADLRSDGPAMVRERLAQPNVTVVDRALVASGAQIDSPVFIESLQDYGGGVVVLGRTGSQAAAAAGDTSSETAGELATAQPFPIKLEAESFHVLRVVGDQGGGKDEIYWCASSGSDQAAGPSFHSQEFGKVQKGQTHTFSAANRTLFEGQVGDWLILQLFCFEADQSNSDWYDALHAKLRELSDFIFDNPAYQVGSNLPGGDLAGWMADINTLGVILMTYLRNEDDLSCSRPFYLDRYDLALLADRGTVDWHFNGIGHHTLKVKYASPQKIPFPAGSLEYTVRAGGSYGAPITLDWQSITPPALASYQNKLHVLFNRPSDKALMWAYLDNGVWSAPRQVNREYSDIACSLAVFRGKLWCAHAGTDGTLGWFTFDGTTWSARTRFSGYETRLAPALAGEYQGRLWLTHVGVEGKLYLNTHDGSTWSSAYRDNLVWIVDSPATMAVGYDGKLWRAARGTDSNLYYSTSSGGAEWRAAEGVTHPSPVSPTLLGHSGGLELFRRMSDNRINSSHYLASQDMWTGGALLGISPMREMAAAEHDGQLYVMCHRT
ncbi:hypothetical protein [Streptomyces sp. AB3(2024)]|uniref:hypothetical protein n=1 Tax=Streptomyces sp. AB3(2024) TaxID=3317321 RepID=UPI0035A36A3B